jgi:hypothetical protein
LPLSQSFARPCTSATYWWGDRDDGRDDLRAFLHDAAGVQNLHDAVR